MNSIAQLENRASRSRSKHEGESSTALCDRHNRTRDFSQRQLPTDQDYAVSTREYQTDQSSLKPAPTAAGPVLDQRQKQRQQQKQPHRCAEIDRITPYQSTFGFTVDSGAPSIPRFFERNGWDTNKVLVYIILENAIAPRFSVGKGAAYKGRRKPRICHEGNLLAIAPPLPKPDLYRITTCASARKPRPAHRPAWQSRTAAGLRRGQGGKTPTPPPQPRPSRPAGCAPFARPSPPAAAPPKPT